MIKNTLYVLAAMPLLLASAHGAEPALSSPDGKLSLTVGAAPVADGKPDGIATFTLSYQGKPLLLPSP